MTSVSGNVISTSVSGNIITAAITVSGNTAIDDFPSASGTALLVANPPKTIFVAYQTIPVTALSGGTQLLSGNSATVSVRNIGNSGTIMFVGSSGTSRAPWAQSDQSGFGWQLKDGDAITIPIQNPELIRVVTQVATSGQRVSYALSNY